MKVARSTEGGDAPGSPGARSENTGLYLSDEQRREAGWNAGRMPRDFCHGLLGVALGALVVLAACGSKASTPTDAAPETAGTQTPPSMAMGGAKSVTTFFITSTGVGRGGNLGGLTGADAHCQALAEAEGSGDHTWRAYLSTMARENEPAVNARDRIGRGPWYNAEGMLVAANVDELHRGGGAIDKETAVTERLDLVNGVGDTPSTHDILTGSRPDGSAFAEEEDLTCENWTSSGEGRAQVGHHDRMGQGATADSWNSAHASRGCSQQDLEATGGAGLFYCFAID